MDLVRKGIGADMEPAGRDETEKRRAADQPAGQQPPKRALKRTQDGQVDISS